MRGASTPSRRPGPPPCWWTRRSSAVDLLSQVELAGGWRDAWLHEERAPDGRWVRGLTEQLAGGKPDYQPMIDRLGQIRHDRGDDLHPAIQITLDRAITALGNDDPAEARKQLRIASRASGNRGTDDDSRLFAQLAKGVTAASHGKQLGDVAQHVDIDQVWRSVGNLASDAQFMDEDHL